MRTTKTSSAEFGGLSVPCLTALKTVFSLGVVSQFPFWSTLIRNDVGLTSMEPSAERKFRTVRKVSPQLFCTK